MFVARCTTGPRRAYSRIYSVDRRDAPLGLAELGRVDIVNQHTCLQNIITLCEKIKTKYFPTNNNYLSNTIILKNVSKHNPMCQVFT